MISCDTETTGVDSRHGAKPFFVTICNEDQNVRFWEWPVNPLTREPKIPEEDIDEIEAVLYDEDEVVFQNAKFDIRMLSILRPRFGKNWNWKSVWDTLIAGHLLASNQPHNLTDMALHYLGVNIQPYEDRLEKAVQEGRRYCRSHLKNWAIAASGREDMPSARGMVWKADTWLPRALLRYWDRVGDREQCRERAHWKTVLSDYANADSSATIALHQVQEEEIKRRGLWEIYLERLKVLPVAYAMENNGVTLSESELRGTKQEFLDESDRCADICTRIAEKYGYELSLPKTGNNRSLMSLCFDSRDEEGEVIKSPLQLPVLKRSKKTGTPSLDREVLELYEGILEEGSEALTFVRALRDKRKRDTSISYLEGYERFWKHKNGGWYRLHPSLNPTGTDTLRWSSANPNAQNISKQEGFNLRGCFGPAPGREWWSMDAKNIELRIPAYESGEEEMIALFERPDDPPYYGSNHLLMAHIVHPEEFEECRNEEGEIDGRVFKKKYASTLYQWTKNGDFAVQYGAIEESGTADRAYHKVGAQAQIQSRFRKIAALNKRIIAFADKHGYVETLPDKTVNPKRGYPLLCTRTEWGRVLPTVPLNYHVQGTACWWMMKAMIRVHERLREWREEDGFSGFIAIQVHDELVIDFPRSKVSPTLSLQESNLWRVKELAKLMEQGGDDLGIPLPASIEYHEKNWSEGVSL